MSTVAQGGGGYSPSSSMRQGDLPPVSTSTVVQGAAVQSPTPRNALLLSKLLFLLRIVSSLLLTWTLLHCTTGSENQAVVTQHLDQAQ